MSAALHTLERGNAIDIVHLRLEDINQRRLCMPAKRGQEVLVALPCQACLFDSAVLLVGTEAALVVRVGTRQWLLRQYGSVSAAIETGYSARNLRWRVRFDGDALPVALEAPEPEFPARLATSTKRTAITAQVVPGLIALLTALQHADAAFPSGSFAFSNGMEGLAALHPEIDATELRGVLAAVLRHRWATSERIAVVQAWRAGSNLVDLAEIDSALEAAILSEPLRTGSRRNGAALLTAHVRLGTSGAAALRACVQTGTMLGHLPIVPGPSLGGTRLG